MSQTNKTKQKISKKKSRRQKYVKERNRMQGRKKKIILKKQVKAVDGAEFYNQLKAQEQGQIKAKTSQEKPKSLAGTIRSLFKGKQRGK